MTTSSTRVCRGCRATYVPSPDEAQWCHDCRNRLHDDLAPFGELLHPEVKFTVAHVQRTKMIGGGTSYEVRFLTSDKPSRPLHGHTYATVICSGRQEFYNVADAISRREWWSMPLGWEKYEAGKKLSAVAARLAFRIAKRAFPELGALKKLPTLWANWTLPSEDRTVPVRMSLPD